MVAERFTLLLVIVFFTFMSISSTFLLYYLVKSFAANNISNYEIITPLGDYIVFVLALLGFVGLLIGPTAFSFLFIKHCVM